MSRRNGAIAVRHMLEHARRAVRAGSSASRPRRQALPLARQPGLEADHVPILHHILPALQPQLAVDLDLLLGLAGRARISGQVDPRPYAHCCFQPVIPSEARNLVAFAKTGRDFSRSASVYTSALMKLFSRSVWMAPAASGALAPMGIVQARIACSPAVKKLCSPSSLYASLASTASAGSASPIAAARWRARRSGR
jgi:hypothetical protein